MPKIVVVREHGIPAGIAVAMYVSKEDIRKGASFHTSKPGRFMFRGAWYARNGKGELVTTKRPNLHDPDAYGKVVGQAGRVIGTLPKEPLPFLLRKLR